MLGGRAAEELVFGQPTTGAESDLQQVTSLAQRMMVQWGMSDEVGLAAYGSDAAAYTRAPLPEARDYAEATTAEMDRAVRKLLDQAYSRAREILERERRLLDALADALVAQETRDGQQRDALLGAPRADPVSANGRVTAGAGGG